jgi:DNA-binding transcriptional LysR family regulator
MKYRGGGNGLAMPGGEAVNLNWLRYFVALAETRNFHEAARRLFVTPQTLSTAISQLEGHLKVRLVERKHRVEGLSDAGEAFLVEARQILRAVENAERRVSEWHGEQVQGPVSLVGNTVWHHYLLPPILARLIPAYPRIRPQLYYMLQDEAEAAVAAGQMDIGLLVQPPRRADLEWEAGLTTDYVIAGRPQPKVPWRELGFIVSRLHGQTTPERQDGWPVDRYPRRIVAEVERLEVAIRLCEAGVGASFVPRLVIEDELHRGSLAEVADSPVEVVNQLHIVWRKGVRPSRAMEILMEALRTLPRNA